MWASGWRRFGDERIWDVAVEVLAPDYAKSTPSPAEPEGQCLVNALTGKVSFGTGLSVLLAVTSYQSHPAYELRRGHEQ